MRDQLYQPGVEYARELIRAGHFVVDKGDWQEVNPGTEQSDAFIEEAGVEAYAKWHLAYKPELDANDKTAYAFPYGDYENVHRSALMAAEERARQYQYEEIRLVAVELLELLDQEAKQND